MWRGNTTTIAGIEPIVRTTVKFYLGGCKAPLTAVRNNRPFWARRTDPPGISSRLVGESRAYQNPDVRSGSLPMFETTQFEAIWMFSTAQLLRTLQVPHTPRGLPLCGGFGESEGHRRRGWTRGPAKGVGPRDPVIHLSGIHLNHFSALLRATRARPRASCHSITATE
jgi:hypothetical protein